MKCSKAERLLSLHLDGRLDRETAARVEAHLAECAACRQTRALLQAAAGALAAQGPAQPSADLAARAFQAALSAGREAKPASALGELLRLARWPAVAAAAASVLLAIALTIQSTPDRSAAPSADDAALSLIVDLDETEFDPVTAAAAVLAEEVE